MAKFGAALSDIDHMRVHPKNIDRHIVVVRDAEAAKHVRDAIVKVCLWALWH